MGRTGQAQEFGGGRLGFCARLLAHSLRGKAQCCVSMKTPRPCATTTWLAFTTRAVAPICATATAPEISA